MVVLFGIFSHPLMGKCDSASATVLSSPLMYVIECSYWDKYSIHRACHSDRSHCELKFWSVLWSVYMYMWMPKRSDCHFMSACMILKSSCLCTGWCSLAPLSCLLSKATGLTVSHVSPKDKMALVHHLLVLQVTKILFWPGFWWSMDVRQSLLRTSPLITSKAH